jgi:predicted ATPase
VSPLADILADHRRSRSLLLTLDNCEDLLSAYAYLIDALLPACPRLRVLSSSREALENPIKLEQVVVLSSCA